MTGTVEGVSIRGIAACVPQREIDNRVFGAALFGDEIEAVVSTTGVEKRRVSTEGRTTSLDLCIKAAKALKEAGSFDFSEFGGIVFVTESPDYLMPNNATQAQTILGLPVSSFAFDVNLACSGYPYGLWVAAMCARSTGKPALLLDGETNSHFASPFDKATALLFGDAGTATILEPDTDACPWLFEFETDGAGRDALIIPGGGYRNRITHDSATYIDYPDGGRRRSIDMEMKGMDVFSFVVRRVPGTIESLMRAQGKTPDDFDFLVLHQANRFMIRQVGKKLRFPQEKVPISIDRFGNSSSATVPLTICANLSEQIAKGPQRMILSGFGAGLSIASVSLTIGPCVCPEVVEYVE